MFSFTDNPNPLYSAPPPWYAYRPTTFETTRILTSYHPSDSAPKGYGSESWLKEQIKQTERELVKYPQRADLRLRVLDLRRALQEVQFKLKTGAKTKKR